MIHNTKLVALLLLITICGSSVYARYTPDWKSLDTRPTPKWYDEAKFGIFTHWGVFSVPAYVSVWFWNYWERPNSTVANYMKKNYPPNFLYADFAGDFHAELFDADHWAELFEASGAKYMALTTKHHDGFCNFRTNYSFNWNSLDVGPKQDLIGAIEKSFRKRGTVHFGLYHSWYEWFNPLYIKDKENGFQTREYVYAKPMPCLHEIINQYQPDFLWSDGDWEANSTYWDSKKFLAWLFNDSPVKDVIVVNDRWGIDAWCKHGDVYNCQDRFNPGVLKKHKWENAMTIDKISWTYRREAVLSEYFTTTELIHQLAITVSCNGNLILNVSPRQDGTFAIIFEERLREIGSWLKINGESIYNTTYWHHQNDTVNGNVWYTASTKDPLTVYAIILDWPANFSVYMHDPIASQGTRITLLGYNESPLSFRSHVTYTEDLIADDGEHYRYKSNLQTGITITLPVLTPNTQLQHAWVLKMTEITTNYKNQWDNIRLPIIKSFDEV